MKKKSSKKGKEQTQIGSFAEGEIVFKDVDCFVVKLTTIGSKNVDRECFGKLREGLDEDWDVGTEIECRIWNKSSCKTGEFNCSYALSADPMFMDENVVFNDTYDFNDLFYGKVQNFLTKNSAGCKYFNVSHFNLPNSILPCENLSKTQKAEFLSAKLWTSIKAVVLEKLSNSYVLGLASELPELTERNTGIDSALKNSQPEKQFRLVRKTDVELILADEDNEDVFKTFNVGKNHLHDFPCISDILFTILKAPLDLSKSVVVLDSENSLATMKPSLVSNSTSEKTEERLSKNGLFVGFVKSIFEHGCFVRTVGGSDVLVPKQVVNVDSSQINFTFRGQIVEADKTQKRYVGISTPKRTSTRYLEQCFRSLSSVGDEYQVQFLKNFILGSIVEVKYFQELPSGQMLVSFDGDVKGEIPSYLLGIVPGLWKIRQMKHAIVVGYNQNYSEVLVAPYIEDNSPEIAASCNKFVNARIVYATSEFYVAYCPSASSIVLFTNKLCSTDKLTEATMGDDYTIMLKEEVNKTVFLGRYPKLAAKSLENCKLWTGKEFSSLEEMKKLYPVGKVVDAVIEKVPATFLLLTLPTCHPAKMFVGHFSHQRHNGQISAHAIAACKGRTIKALVIGYKRFKHSRTLGITNSVEECSRVFVLLRNVNVPLKEDVIHSEYPFLYGNEIIENDSFFLKYRADQEIMEKTKEEKSFGCFIETCFENVIIFRLSPSIVVALELGLCSNNANLLNNHGKCLRPGVYITGQCSTYPDKANPNLIVVSLSVAEKKELKVGSRIVGRVKKEKGVNVLKVPLYPRTKFVCNKKLPQHGKFFNCQIVEKKNNIKYLVKIVGVEKREAEKCSPKEVVIGDEERKKKKRMHEIEAEEENSKEEAADKNYGKLDLSKGVEKGNQKPVIKIRANFQTRKKNQIQRSGLQVSWSDDDVIESSLQSKYQNPAYQPSKHSLDPEMLDYIEYSDNDVIQNDNDPVDELYEPDATSDFEPTVPSKKSKFESIEANDGQTVPTVSVQNDVMKFYELAVLSEPNSADNWMSYMKYFMREDSPNLAEVRKIHDRAMSAMDDLLYDERLNVSVTLLEAELKFGTPESLEDCFSYAVQRNNPLEVHLKMATLYDKNGKTKNAADTYKLAIKKFKHNKRPWLSYLEHIYQNERFQDAAAVVTASFASLTKQEHLEIIMKSASLEFKFGEIERGKTSMEHLISTYPKDPRIWDHYMELLFSKQDYEGVREIFGRLLSIQLRKFKLTSLFTKYLDFEKLHGTKEQIQSAQDKYHKYFPQTGEKDREKENK